MHATNENVPPQRPFLVKLLVRSWEYRYRRLFWGLRCAGGVVMVGLSLLLFSYGSWWGLVPLAGAAAAFFGGHWIYQVTQSRPAASAR
jgi:hypothetical protein